MPIGSLHKYGGRCLNLRPHSSSVLRLVGSGHFSKSPTLMFWSNVNNDNYYIMQACRCHRFELKLDTLRWFKSLYFSLRPLGYTRTTRIGLISPPHRCPYHSWQVNDVDRARDANSLYIGFARSHVLRIELQFHVRSRDHFFVRDVICTCKF